MSVKEHHPKDQVIIYYTELPDDVVKILPKCAKKLDVDGNSHDKSSNLPNMKLKFWSRAFEGAEGETIIFMDSDTILRGNIDEYTSNDYDILYTYQTNKTGNPWLLNTGIIFAKNTTEVSNFIKYWNSETERHLSNKTMTNKCASEWGAVDQSIVGRHLNIKTTDDCEKIIEKNGLKFKGVSCEILNECLCVPLDKTNPLIIHYKTRWHPVLPGGHFHKTRPKEKCMDMYELWMKYYTAYNKKYLGVV